MPARTGIALALAAVLTFTLAGCTNGDAPSPSPSSPPELSLELVDGPSNPEDLVEVAGTPYLLVSGLSLGPEGQPQGGELVSINSETGENETVWPVDEPSVEYDSSAYPDCDPVPQAAISPHGLAFRPHEDGLGGELLVINHEREAVEVFDVGSEGSSVTLTWIGCVPLAADMYGNGVAVSDDGETLFVTKFFNPATRDADLGALLSGDPSGEVRTWTKGEGWRAVPGTELAGANGIALSPDASAIFVAEWGGQKLWRFDLTGDTEPQSVALDFWPDNLRWGDDGLLYVTGQEVTPAQVPSCLAGDITACPYTGFDILAIDPETLDTSVVFAYDGQDFGHTTVALPVGDDYWIGTIFGDKVGKLTAAP